MIVIALSTSWPWVSRHYCPAVPKKAPGQMVRIENGKHGYVISHEADGFVISLPDGTTVKRAAFTPVN